MERKNLVRLEKKISWTWSFEASIVICLSLLLLLLPPRGSMNRGGGRRWGAVSQSIKGYNRWYRDCVRWACCCLFWGLCGGRGWNDSFREGGVVISRSLLRREIEILEIIKLSDIFRSISCCIVDLYSRSCTGIETKKFIYSYIYMYLAVKKAVLHGTTFDTWTVVKRSHSLRVNSIAIS